ncbi:hypothetical protein A2U01_0118286, partial [Trifolium medium]|nr:hypothetical protein [Trifolium medium]
PLQPPCHFNHRAGTAQEPRRRHLSNFVICSPPPPPRPHHHAATVTP